MTLRAYVAGAAACLAVALSAIAAAGPARGQDSGAATAVGQHQILVMLKMAPPHYRPNATYGGGYGDSIGLAARRRAADRIARKAGLRVSDNWPMELIGVDCFVMDVPASVSVADAVERVSKDAMVAWSQPMHVYRTRGQAARSGDPLLAAQPAAVSWRLRDLHRIATGRGVTIAVIDSKVDIAHPDLAGQVVAARDFVGAAGTPEKHGTAVAGVIAAKAGNGIGIAGIAPGSRLMALRACAQSDATTLCDTLSLAKALNYAIEHRAGVINLSLSGPHDRLLEKLLGVAIARNSSVVAAFDPGARDGGFPASQPGVVAVADESLRTYPAKVYGAPGRDVPTTRPGGTWYLVNGSSYAAAHVSGLMALLREERGPKVGRGALARHGPRGAIDACATLVRIAPDCDCSCSVGNEGRAARAR